MDIQARLFLDIKLVTFVAALILALPAQAERADRDKPVNLEADRITVDDVKKVHVFEGNVILTQGTLMITTEKLVVTQDSEGFQKGVATGGSGGLARFRQKREGKDEYVDGRAERIEYDGKAEKSELFVRAYLKSGLDEVRGQYVSYDGKSESYIVSGGTSANAAVVPGKDSRVRAVIQPKHKEGAKPASIPSSKTAPAPAISTEPVPLKGAHDIANPRQE